MHVDFRVGMGNVDGKKGREGEGKSFVYESSRVRDRYTRAR